MATPAVNAIAGDSGSREAGPNDFGPNEAGRAWRVVLAAYFGVMVSFGSLLVFSFGTFLKPLSAEFGWTRESVSCVVRARGAHSRGVLSGPGPLARSIRPAPDHSPLYDGFRARVSVARFADRAHLASVRDFCPFGRGGQRDHADGLLARSLHMVCAAGGMALSLVMAGSATGAIIFPPLAQALITAQGWRTAYFLLGGMVLVSASR